MKILSNKILNVSPFKNALFNVVVQCLSKKFVCKAHILFSYQKRLKLFLEFLTKKSFNSRNSTNGKYFNFVSSYLQLLTSHSSTSAQVSPSTPSVLQTAYAKGSTVSSVITEPILPRPLTPTVFPLLHYNNRKHVNVRKKINAVKILITYIIFAASIGQRTYIVEAVEVVVISKEISRQPIE